MSESERYIDYRRKKISLGSDGNALTALISINAIIFLVLVFIKMMYLISQSTAGDFKLEIEQWFTLPASLPVLAHKPWTILSYMFTHTGLIFAISNMLWLWVFGSIFQDLVGNKKLIPVYIYGGIIGACLFIGAYYLFPFAAPPSGGILEGASPSIMAIAVAVTTLAPNFRFFRMLNGGIPLWAITLVFIIIDFAGIGADGPQLILSHMGGGLVGFAFMIRLRRGRDSGRWMNNFYSRILNLFNPAIQKPPVKKIKEKVFYKTGNQKPFVKKLNVTQERIDEILDKINQKGYHLLSEEEKIILRRAADTDL